MVYNIFITLVDTHCTMEERQSICKNESKNKRHYIREHFCNIIALEKRIGGRNNDQEPYYKIKTGGTQNMQFLHTLQKSSNIDDKIISKQKFSQIHSWNIWQKYEKITTGMYSLQKKMDIPKNPNINNYNKKIASLKDASPIQLLCRNNIKLQPILKEEKKFYIYAQ